MDTGNQNYFLKQDFRSHQSLLSLLPLQPGPGYLTGKGWTERIIKQNGYHYLDFVAPINIPGWTI